MTPGVDYTIPGNSDTAASQFAASTGFTKETMWKNEMYPGEYMNYVSKESGNVSMVEFEVPQSATKSNTVAKWNSGFTGFLQAALK